MNYTHELASAHERITELESRIESLAANLTAAGAANLALTHTLISRTLLEAVSPWAQVLAEIAQLASCDLLEMPIAGPHAAEIRQYAQKIVTGSVNKIGDDVTAYFDEVDRPRAEAGPRRPH